MEKLKVVLLDDEILTRKLIRMKVDWKRLNLEVVAEFSNGRKALEQIESIKPDIVITDICLAGMDGIEFSEACMRLLPNIKIMILTSHDEFEYAKKSINIGVSDYILKPINEEEITRSLCTMIQKKYKEYLVKKEYQALRDCIEEHLPTFREKYLNQVLIHSDEVAVFCNKMSNFHVRLNPLSTQIQIAILKLESIKRKIDEQDSDRSEVNLYIKAKKLTEDFFSGDRYMMFCRDGLGRIVVICNNPEVPLLECLELLRRMLMTHLGCDVAIGASLKKQDYSQISCAYKEAVDALDDKVLELSNKVIYYNKFIKSKAVISTTDNLVQEILTFMSKNIADSKLSMNKVAEHAFISTGYLGRIIKKYTGKTYGEYLSELRFNKAKELLENTDLRGYEIGERIGISDAHYLSIWFRKMSGYSLSEYRKRLNDNKDKKSILG